MAVRVSPVGPITHEAFQQQVIDLAHALGWRHLHVRRSIGKGKRWVTATNVEGWPDLYLWHPTRGGQRAIEVKVGKDKLRPAQEVVLAELERSGVPTLVARPEDVEGLKRFLGPWLFGGV